MLGVGIGVGLQHSRGYGTAPGFERFMVLKPGGGWWTFQVLKADNSGWEDFQVRKHV